MTDLALEAHDRSPVCDLWKALLPALPAILGSVVMPDPAQAAQEIIRHSASDTRVAALSTSTGPLAPPNITLPIHPDTTYLSDSDFTPPPTKPDTLVTNLRLIRGGLPIKFHYGVEVTAGQVSVHEANYQNSSFLRIEFKPRNALKSYAKPADVIIPANFYDSQGGRIITFGNSAPTDPSAIPISPSAQVTVTYSFKGGHRTTLVRIKPDADSKDAYNMKISAFPGDSLFKDVTVNLSREVSARHGKATLTNFDPVFVRQINVNQLRKLSSH